MVEPGTVIGGKLRVEKILGHGGMGVVAIARHVELDQRVAIKVLRDELASDPTICERFLREAKTPMRLRSDHVCRVLDVGRLESGAPYIQMELLDGSDLSVLVRSRGPLPVPTAAEYVLQACIAIAEAHALGIVHRDLKPANLFLSRRLDGTPLVKVLDFGIAKVPAKGDVGLTQTTAVFGSPGYMSPEQLRSARDVDARADVWALGVILYELASGRLPFPATNVTEAAVKIAVDPPDPIDVDPAYRAIVLRCLEKEPAQRYPDVGALARELAGFAGASGARHAELVGKLLANSSQTLPFGSGAHAAPPIAAPGNATVPTTLGAAAGETRAAATAEPEKRRRPWWAAGGVLALGAAAAGGYVIATRSANVTVSRDAATVAIVELTPTPSPSPAAGPAPAPAPAPPPDAAIAPPRDAAPPRVAAATPHAAKAAAPPSPPPPPPAPAPRNDPAADPVVPLEQEAFANYAMHLIADDKWRALLYDSAKVLVDHPDHAQALYYLVDAACALDEAGVAKKYAPKLSASDRHGLARTICLQHGIKIETP